MGINVKNATNPFGKLIVRSRKTTDQTLSVAVKTTVHSVNFVVPASGSAQVDGAVNGSYGNNVAGTVFVELYLSGSLVTGAARSFGAHGHTASALNGSHVHLYESGLTPGTTYEARISVTPTGGTLNIRCLTNPTTEQVQIAALVL